MMCSPEKRCSLHPTYLKMRKVKVSHVPTRLSCQGGAESGWEPAARPQGLRPHHSASLLCQTQPGICRVPPSSQQAWCPQVSPGVSKTHGTCALSRAAEEPAAAAPGGKAGLLTRARATQLPALTSPGTAHCSFQNIHPLFSAPTPSLGSGKEPKPHPGRFAWKVP